MKFMVRWLEARGAGSREVPNSHSRGGHSSRKEMLMPGMPTNEQMDALKKAKDRDFDLLFLTGMIQHHNGALIMVDELFNTAGAG